ncbi:MAG TPA: hypothetical protein DET40_11090 [Lentisphaeria bacterium]|nr:MAG: hypothetical protein A2X45_20100 [Lentisphaerae bacterium GWF2_50_93]HCE44083.1 hypothetical protein [Lentisphaeria bacterium]
MKALIWKELREYRMFLVAAVLLLILVKAASIILLNAYPLHKDLGMYFAVTGWTVLPIFFSFIGSIIFTSEFSQNTKSFLLTKPCETAKIFFVKYFTGFGLLIALDILSFVLTDPSEMGKKGTFRDYAILVTYAGSLSVLSYSYIIFVSLITRQTLASIFLAPLIVVPELVCLCPFMVCIYYYCRWELVMPLISLLLISTNLALSYLAWQRALVKDIKPWKVLARAGAIILVIAWSFHLIISIQSQLQLSSAKAKAEKAGFDFNILDKLCERIPDEENAAANFREAERKLDVIKAKYDSSDMAREAGNSSVWKELRNFNIQTDTIKLTKEQRAKIVKFLAEDKEIMNLCNFIKKGTALKKYSVWNDAVKFNAFYESHKNLKNLLMFTECRISALSEEGRVEEALEAMNVGLKMIPDLVRLRVYYITSSYGYSSDYSNMVRCLLNVPEDPKMIPYLKDLMLKADDFKNLDYIENWFTGSVPMIYIQYYQEMMDARLLQERAYVGFDPKSARLYTNFIVSPYLKKDATSYLLKSTSLMKDFKNSAEIKPPDPTAFGEYPVFGLKEKILMNNVFIYATDVFRYELAYRNDLKNTDIDLFKLSAALKIFKIQNGEYPDKIEQLVPDIIPEIPGNLFSKKRMVYCRVGDGFGISSDMQKSWYRSEGIYLDR